MIKNNQKFCYKIFHANLAFSSIEEEKIGQVIDKSYFPLLDLLEKNDQIKIGLEISGYSLEKIMQLRPNWIKKLKYLYSSGRIELLASGYMQIIGPLVPSIINKKNHELGLNVYKQILDICPKVVYVNEQVLSASIIDFYCEFGYEALVMEWNNLFSSNKNKWNIENSYQPILLRGFKSKIPVIWTDTLLFQQYQRTVHSEKTKDDYFKFLDNYLVPDYQCVPIYSSDLEVFGYRPGRFENEAIISGDEWLRIDEISRVLSKNFQFVKPSDVLKNIKKIELFPFTESVPVIVKKQDKYSLSRWAACGRNSNYINTLCYRYLNYIKESKNNSDWKKLVEMWGSDFRTHITEKRWEKAISFLQKNAPDDFIKKPFGLTRIITDKAFKIDKNVMLFDKYDIKLSFLINKGLALDKMYVENRLLNIGTAHHGFFKNMSYAADFYCGSSLIQDIFHRNISDLCVCNDILIFKGDNKVFEVQALINASPSVSFLKTWTIDCENRFLSLTVVANIKHSVAGTIRLANITLRGEQKYLDWYETHNGGFEPERFCILEDIGQHFPKSLIQSSSTGLGVTEDGYIAFGGRNDYSKFNIKSDYSSPFVMLQSYTENKNRMLRVYCSTQEVDDTFKVQDIHKNIEFEKKVHWKFKF